MYWLPARILDDLMICRTRAWFTIRRTRGREIPHHRGAKALQEAFLNQLEQACEQAGNVMLFQKEKPVSVKLTCDSNAVGLRGKVDAFLIIHIGGSLRGIALETAQTGAEHVLRRGYILPRLLLYASSLNLSLGLTTVAVYLSLSASGRIRGLMFRGGNVAGFHVKIPPMYNLCRELASIMERETPPKPRGLCFCAECRYRFLCPHMRI